MVGVDSGSLQADSQPKSFGLVWGLAAAWCRSTFIKWILNEWVLNAAARFIYQLRSSKYIIDSLVCLHWLRIPEHIEYKITLLTYRVINGMALWYLEPLSVSPTCLADGLCVLQSQIVWQYQLLNCLRSAAERFPFPFLKRGTNYRKKSPLRHLCLPSNVASRRSYLEKHSGTLLLIDILVNLVVILNYLGHSKEFCLIDWLIEMNRVNCRNGSAMTTAP